MPPFTYALPSATDSLVLEAAPRVYWLRSARLTAEITAL